MLTGARVVRFSAGCHRRRTGGPTRSTLRRRGDEARGQDSRCSGGVARAGGWSGRRRKVVLPAVVTVQSGINEPRYVTMRSMRAAAEKSIERIDPDDLGPPACQVRRMSVPQRRRAESLEGSVSDIAHQLANLVNVAYGPVRAADRCQRPARRRPSRLSAVAQTLSAGWHFCLVAPGVVVAATAYGVAVVVLWSMLYGHLLAQVVAGTGAAAWYLSPAGAWEARLRAARQSAGGRSLAEPSK